MADDTTTDASTDTNSTSRHVSVWIDAAPEEVYAVVADPATWPRWAAGLAEGELRETPQGWVADSPMGRVSVQFSPVNEFGVLDHVVTLPSGEQVYNPLRIVPAGVGERRSEVVFTLRRRPGVSAEEFEADAAAVTADLETLRGLVTG